MLSWEERLPPWRSLPGWDLMPQARLTAVIPGAIIGKKITVVQQGLARSGLWTSGHSVSPLAVVAAVGDPMQPVVAGMAMAASNTKPVMLAGGTQMLAVYGLMTALAKAHGCPWLPQQVIVGTTRWVAEDPTGDTAGLATEVNAALVGSQLSFQQSRFWGCCGPTSRGLLKKASGLGLARNRSFVVPKLGANRVVGHHRSLA